VAGAGLLCNLLLAALKFTCGIIASSQAVVADAAHSLSDCTTDLVIIFASGYWSKPADDDHPYGHRRLEILVTVFIGIVLAAVGCGLIWRAFVTMGERQANPPGRIALYAVLFSILVKELLFRWTMLKATELQSSSLVANAWHHRSDVFSSVPAGLAVLGAEMFPDWTYIDNIGAVVVSVLIFQSAWRITIPELNKLVDRSGSQKETEEIRGIVLETEGVVGTHAIRTRYTGGGVMAIDLHVQVDGNMSVYHGHEVADMVKNRLLEHGPGIVDVVVHLEPADDSENTDILKGEENENR